MGKKMGNSSGTGVMVFEYKVSTRMGTYMEGGENTTCMERSRMKQCLRMTSR